MGQQQGRQKVTGWVVVKAVDTANRRIGGYFSTRYTDREGEEFAPEAFAASIAPGGSYYANPVLLYNHDADRLIGKADVTTLGHDEVGAYGEFIVSEDDAWGQIERGELRGFSWFGFIDPSKTQVRSEGGQQIPVHYAVDLVEVTATPIPCNPSALFEVRSKALQVGKAKTTDFPAGQAEGERKVPEEQEPAKKAVHLGQWTEAWMSLAAINEAWSALYWRVADVLESAEGTAEERMTRIEALFGEFGELNLKVIGAILAGTAAMEPTAAVKQIRALWKSPVGPEPASKSAAPKGENTDMTPEEVQALVAPVDQRVKGLEDKIDALLTKLGGTGEPAATTTETAGTTGEPAAKAVGSEEELGKLADAIVSRMGVQPGAKKGLVEDDRGQEAASTKRFRRVTETAHKAREAGFGSNRAKSLLDGALREGLALEATGGAKGYLDLDGEGE